MLRTVTLTLHAYGGPRLRVVFARCPAGTMMSVNRENTGPAKRAIVMCAHDKDRVIEVSCLLIDMTETAASVRWGDQKY